MIRILREAILLNKNIPVIGIIILLIVSALAPMSIGYNVRTSIIKNNGNTLYVGGDGPNNYTSIQSAINDAFDGDTVFVYDESSPYYENIWINDTINLIGENRNSTIIDGNYRGDVVNISADWVTVSGFTIQNSGEEFFDAGIVLRANHITLSRNNISNNLLGIKQEFFTKYVFTNISENIILNNHYGLVSIYGFDDNTISYNKFISNNNSITLQECINNTFIGNNFSYNYDGLNLRYSRYNRIIDNKFLNNNNSIDFYHSENNAILDNIISNNYGGIGFLDSFNNTIIDNNISKSSIGIFLLDSNNNTIIDNVVTNNEGGIYFFDSVFNILKGNSIADSINDGLHFTYSSNNSVTENFIKNNNIGITISSRSYDNLITENNIMYNLDGIILSGVPRNNSIYHNNLINEDNNAWDFGTNIWDDGKYGNYWSDYKEKYPNSKPNLLKPWMWNTPYEIEAGSNKDMCPLVDEWPDSKPRTISRNTALYSSFL